MFKKLSTKEIIFYLIALAAFLTGVIFAILGIVGSHLSVDSYLFKVQIKFSWRWIGLIIIGCGVIIALITLLISAKKTDRISEREIRRKQRLSAMMSDVEEKEETVVINKNDLGSNLK